MKQRAKVTTTEEIREVYQKDTREALRQLAIIRDGQRKTKKEQGAGKTAGTAAAVSEGTGGGVAAATTAVRNRKARATKSAATKDSGVARSNS